MWALAAFRRSGPSLFRAARGVSATFASSATKSTATPVKSAATPANSVATTVADGVAQRVFLRPPGAGAIPDKVRRFSELLSKTIANGEDIELEARGAHAVQNVIKAMAHAHRSVEFEVTFGGTGGSVGGDRSLQFVARPGPTWQEYRQTPFREAKGMFIRRETQVVQAARALAHEFRDGHTAMRVHTFVEDEQCINLLAKVLALARTTLGYRRLVCTPKIVKGVEDSRARVFVYVQDRGTLTPPLMPGTEFVATPPGPNPDPAVLRRFTETVTDRLHRGEVVSMECRGPQPLQHSMRALCLLQGNVAEFEAEWASIPGSPRTGQSAELQGTEPETAHMLNVLRLKARRAETWDDFNDQDFSKTELLRASEKTEVKKLAWAVAQEVRQRGGVAVHTHSDNDTAVGIAVKALATLPKLTSGERVVAVPSYGRTAQNKQPVIRFYVRRPPGQPGGSPSADAP